MNTVKRILALFENSGKSKRSILLELGFSPTALAEWNRGKAKPTVEAIIKLATYFNVSTDYLLCLSNNPTSLDAEQTKKAVPMERLNSDILTVENIELMLAENDGFDWIEKLYKELKDKQQRLYVLTWIIAYMASEGLPVKQILGE